MANILKNPSFKDQQGYNGFPLRSSIQFSSALGQLLPIWWHPLDPGDKVKVNTALVTRTQPVNSAAMIDIHEHLDWFFVPLQNLYKWFEDVFYGINDVHSSIIESSSLNSTLFPYWTVQDLHDYVVNQYHVSSGDNPTWPATEADDIAGQSRLAGIFRIMECLGYDVVRMYEGGLPDSSGYLPARSLWSAAAYQAIYYSHYRLSDFVANNPKAYNLDRFYNKPHVDSISDDEQFGDFFQLHYRPIKQDYFHAFRPAPLFGNASLNSLGTYGGQFGSVGLGDYLSSYILNGLSSVVGSSSDSLPRTTGTQSEDELVTSVGVYPQGDGSGPISQGLNTAAIRGAFAYEKLLEVTRRAGKHIDAQTLAHFGVKMPEGIAGEPIFLGSNDSTFHISDVISSADTESAPLGEIAGKGYNRAGSGTIKFEAKCHGILMCIYSSDTDLHYTPTNVDELNTMVSPYRFYHPEFDDLGQQPIFEYQGNIRYDWQVNMSTVNNSIRGWTYRYWAQKMKYNRAIGSFYGGMSHWTVSRQGFLTASVVSQTSSDISNLIVRPDYLNDIMLANFSSRVYPYETASGGIIPDGQQNPSSAGTQMKWREDLYGYDPMIHDLYVDCSLVSKKSTYGLPHL